MKLLIPAVLLVVSAATASAQVGYTPEKSPYHDLDKSQSWSLLYGHYTGRPDAAGVAPSGGSMLGLLYEWHAGGPIYLTGALSRVDGQREVLDPYQTAPKRTLGMAYWPLWALDGGMSVSLTGDRTWHDIMPLAKFGLGIMSDRHTRGDVGDYMFGTRFSFTWGAAVRWIPTERWAVRADLTNYFMSMSYPQTYYLVAKDSTSILKPNQSKSFWRNNPAITIGLSYLYSH